MRGRSRGPSWWLRFGAVLALSTGLGVVLEPVAIGQTGTVATSTVLVTQTNWYWREQATNIGGTGISPPSPLSDPTVPSGDLAVSGPEVNGQADKESYLEFDVSAIPPGSTIVSFVVKLPVDPNAGTQTTPQQVGAPPIIACLPRNSWSAGAGAESFSGKPADQCPSNAPKFATTDGGKTYSADITPIAQSWVQQGAINTGVAVTDDPSNSTSAYQVVFGPTSAITQLTASVTYQPASSAANSSGPSPSSGTGPSATLGTGSVSVPSLGTSSPSTGGFTPVSTPSATSSKPSSNSSSAPTGRSATRATLSSASSAPPGVFWLAGVLLLMLLLSISLVLGDEPVAPPTRRRKLVGALTAWQRSTASTSTEPR